MARCEDFPCCGHEAGCCPDYDEGGRQLNMRCVCGAVVPLSSRSSLCPTCLAEGEDEDGEFFEEDEDLREEPREEENEELDMDRDTPLGDEYGGE